MALDPTLIPLLRMRLTEALLDRTGHAVPPPDQQVWLGPLRHPVDDSAIMALAGAAYAGGVPTTLVAACIPAQGFLEALQRPRDPGLLALLNEADDIIDFSPGDGLVPAETLRSLATRARDRQQDLLQYTGSGVLLVQPLQAGLGRLVYLLPYRLLVDALAAELAGIVAAMLVLVGGIVLTARYWSRNLLRRTHADASRALESELMTHILVSATPVGLCIVRQRDYAVLMSNRQADTLLQVQACGPMPPALVQAFGNQPRIGGKGPEAIASFTVATPTTALPADAGRFLQITYAPARYRDDDVLFCAVHDCTAQQALQDQLRSAQQATESMMRARSTFFAAMSHEIRTPLNALLGNLELLARSPGLEAHTPRLKALDTAAEALRRIVNDVLDFSKIDAGKLELVEEPFRPADALESLALTYAPMTAGRPLRMSLHLSPSLDVDITGDRTRLEQVFNNLLNNAFKFTTSGRIALSGELVANERGVPQLVCRVSDSGIGMPPALMERAFQPFVQGDGASASRFGGTGLGLSICARLCELMGGSIAVASVPDVGSAFTVTIPARGMQAVPAAGAAPARRGHVMVLCQDARTAESLDAWLQSAGWHTSVLGSVAAAREYLSFTPVQAIVASDEFTLASLDALRKTVPATVAWVTPDGPHRPQLRVPGILEVTAFSHRALLACVAMASDSAAADMAERAGEGGNAAGATTLSADAAATPPTILVAEDNPLNQALIAEQLQALGCQPIVVSHGRQALAVLETTPVDALLTDIQMPGMNGYELLEAVRARHAGVPVLAFSAFARSEWSADWRQRGFAGYVSKPASLQDLQACLRSLPGRCQAQAAAPADAGTDAEAADRERYEAMLRSQLRQDLPELERIIAHCELPALRCWTHSVAGAFMIVRRKSIVRECRALEALCAAAGGWTPAIAAAAAALRERLRGYMGDTAAAA
ncbi:Sensor histidine kinase RcsC [compost metagenome]